MAEHTITLTTEELYAVLGSLRCSRRKNVRDAGRKIRLQVELPLRCPVTYPSEECGDFQTDSRPDAEIMLANHLIEGHGMHAQLAAVRAAEAVTKWAGAEVVPDEPLV